MKTICVAGTQSGVGKTSLVEMLLRVLKGWPRSNKLERGWSAAKISAGHAHGGEPFGIVTRRSLIAEPGTDTARFLAAGAKRVFWVWTMRNALKNAVTELMGRLRRGENLIVEGNSFARAARPDVTVMVAGVGRAEMKSSARAILRKVDIVVLRVDRDDTAQDVAQAVKWWKDRAKVKDVFAVRSFQRGNAKFLRCVLKRLQQAPNEKPGFSQKPGFWCIHSRARCEQ